MGSTPTGAGLHIEGGPLSQSQACIWSGDLTEGGAHAWGAGLAGSDLQDVIRAAAGFLDDDVDEVQLGDHGRWQYEGVEIGLAHGA